MSEKQVTHTPGPWHCGQLNGEGAIFANNGKRLTIENGLHSLHPICHVQNTFGKEDKAMDAKTRTDLSDTLNAISWGVTQ